MKLIKILIAVILSLSCIFGLAACGCNSSEEADVEYSWDAANIADTSDLPTWTGKQITLKVDASAYSGITSNDVVYNEIKRVTGVTLVDSDGYYNENIYMGTTADKAEMISTGRFYQLTDLLPKYAPNLVERYGSYDETLFNQIIINGGINKTIYGVPYSIQNAGLSDVYSSVDAADSIKYNKIRESYGFVYVRDDILTALYPNAKSQAELEQIYIDNGAFTEEQLFDVNIDSEEAFMNFLNDVASYITTNSATLSDVNATYIRNGSDNNNWDLMQMILSTLYGAPSGVEEMYLYWDRAEEEVLSVLEQGFFQNSLELLNKAYRDGVIDPDCMNADFTSADFLTKLDDGKYAVTFADDKPTSTEVSYRKVYINIPQSDSFAYLSAAEASSNCVYINKNVAEVDLPQVLMWLDYQSSYLADRLYAWGPRSAGLFTESNGVRNYVTSQTALKSYMVNNTTNTTYSNQYNLWNGVLKGSMPVFSYFNLAASNYTPAIMCERARVAEDTDLYFSSYAVFGEPELDKVLRLTTMADWYEDMPSIENATFKFSIINNQLVEVIKAGSDNLFASRLDTFLVTARANGFSIGTARALDNSFKELNANYWVHIRTNASNSSNN